MKRPSPTPLALGLTALSAQFGVTRLARVTGLDRCDVEVCAAVRPRGHVLQVSQGKGLTFEAAQWSALGEAIELAAAEQPDAARLVYASAPPGTPWAVGDERIAWVEGRLLSTGAPVLVPAQEVYCPPAGAAWLGPISVQWKSNGLGFHPHLPPSSGDARGTRGAGARCGGSGAARRVDRRGGLQSAGAWGQ
jgi:ribosomal protein S12 methylthiotransferase accessory factor